MRGIPAILRSIFISPEFLVVIAGVALACVFPRECIWISQRISQQPELLKYAWLLPAGLVAYDLNVAKSILLPDADKKMLLQGWQRYWELKSTTTVGVLYGFGFAVAGLVTMAFDWKVPASHQSATLLTAVIGAVAVAASLFYAQIRIEELFREHNQTKSPR
jgi:hypothetical protein